jgi:hypothetical protein
MNERADKCICIRNQPICRTPRPPPNRGCEIVCSKIILWRVLLQSQQIHGEIKLKFAKNTFSFVTISLSIMCASSSIAEDRTFPDRAKQTWIARNASIVEAANFQTDNIDTYVNGLKAACNGVTGEWFSGPVPNYANMPQGSFCNAVSEFKEQALGGASRSITGRRKWGALNNYCGMFNAAANQARRIQATGDNAAIVESAQQLATAAEKVRNGHYEISRTAFGGGLFGNDRNRTETLQCQ